MSGELGPIGGDGRPAEALRKLRALGLRGHERDARALLGGPPPGQGRLIEALEELEAREAAEGPTAWSGALKGRLLLLLRQPARARAELDRAAALDPALLEARVWRAQAALALRDGAGALADLDALAAARRPSGWEEYLRGLALMTLGRTEEALPKLRAAERRGVGARAAGMWALALAELRRFPEALKLLANARRTSEAEGVPLGAFEGLILRQKGDLEGSLRALIRAGRGANPYPWVFSHRADVHNRMGFYQQALADLKRFHELVPRESAAFTQAANVLYDQAFYDEALVAMRAASVLAPGDHDLQARRAHILVSAGRLREAIRVIRAGLRLSPGDVHLREELIETAVMAGDAALAARELSRGGLEETPFGLVMRGVLAARAGARPRAAGLFDAAASRLEPGDPLRERARFYGAIVRALKPGRGLPGLSLCGVGVRHPFQLTVETLQALARSRRLFTNLPDVEARRFLALFPGEVLSVPRRADKTNRDRAKWIVRRLRPGESAAFLTRIHPFIYRRMGWDLLELCRGRNIPARAFGAVSLTELAACRAFDEGAAPETGTFRVFDIGHLNRNPDLLRPSEPTVIYCIGAARDRPRLVRLLRRSYPASGGTYVLGGSGDREDRAVWTPWRRLGLALRLADIGCVLYVPAGGKGAPARRGRGPLARLHGLGSRPGETTLETLAALADGSGARALPGAYPLAGAAARRLAARGPVRATPSVSPVGSAFARARFCLGGDYGYQGISACEASRLLAEPALHTPRLPLVVHGGRGTPWTRVGSLLAQRLPPGHLVHAYPQRGGESLVPAAKLGRALKGGGTALVPPTVPPACPDLS